MPFFHLIIGVIHVECGEKIENTDKRKEENINVHDPTSHTTWRPYQMVLLHLYIKIMHTFL